MWTSPPEPSTMEWFIVFTNSSLQSGLGIAGGIVVMCTVVNHAAVLGQRNACRCRQEQTVAERHIGRNRLAAALRQLGEDSSGMSSVEWESSEQSLYANTGVRSRDVPSMP